MAGRSCTIRLFVVGASLSSTSLNNRLASLAGDVITEKGGVADRATVADFECPLYDHDIETTGPMPEGARRFCERLEDADGLVLASP